MVYLIFADHFQLRVVNSLVVERKKKKKSTGTNLVTTEGRKRIKYEVWLMPMSPNLLLTIQKAVVSSDNSKTLFPFIFAFSL